MRWLSLWAVSHLDLCCLQSLRIIIIACGSERFIFKVQITTAADNVLIFFFFFFLYLYTPPHNSSGYYGFTLFVSASVHLSVHLSVVHQSVFLFADNNLSKFQWIFTKLGMCIDTVEIWFGIANGQSSSIFDSYQPATHPYFVFNTITWVNTSGFSPNLVYALILWRSGLE